VFADRARIRGALAEATLGTQRAEQVTDLMLGLFQASEGGKALSDSVTARELLDRGLARAHELSGQPALQAQMLDAVGRIYTQLGDYAPARATLLEALAIRRRIYGSENVDVLTSLESLGDVADKQETPDDVSLRREAFTLSRRLSGDNDPRTIDRTFDYAVALHRTANYHAADSLFDVWMAAAARQPTAPTAERADRLALLASFLQIRGQFARAEPMLREALAIRRSLYGERHSQVGEALTDLGIFYDAWRKEPQADTAMAEALDIMRAAYPNGHPRLASIIRLRAIVYEHSARFQEAEPLLRESLGMRQRLLGPNSLDVASVELDLAFALNNLGKYDEALALARHATSIYSARFDAHNAMLAFAHIHVGDALRGLGHYAEAEPILLAAFTRFEKPNSVTRQWRGYAAASLARLYDAEGRAGDAEKYRALVR
jgi:serine/threonine-protein kinase